MRSLVYMSGINYLKSMEDEGFFKSLSASFVFEEDENDDADEISDVEAETQPNQESLEQKRGKKRQQAGYDDFYGDDEYSASDVETFSSRKKSSKAFSVKPKLRFALKSMKAGNSQAAKSDKSSDLETRRLKETESLKDFKGSWRRVSRDEVSGDCIDSDNETDPEDNTDKISSKVPPLAAEDFQNEPASTSEDGHLAREATRFGFSAQLKESLQEKGQCLNSKYEASEASHCLDLRILEEWVEAHLITCRCEILHCPEEWQNSSSLSHADGAQKGLVTAMFDTTARTCLDLLVGRVVRIHPPWHELQVKGYGRVILCTYNSEMLPQKIDVSE